MDIKKYNAGGKEITLYLSEEEGRPLIVLNNYVGDGKSVVTEMEKQSNKAFNLLCVGRVTPAHLANKAGEQPGGAKMLEYSKHFVYFPGPECDPMDQANAYGEYFVGQSYLAPVSKEQIPVFNVTFDPGCRNNRHIHHAQSGGGQMLICVGGGGYYQEWGKDPVEMTPGTVLNIPAEVKHWHGAAADSWFSHLALEIPGEDGSTEWCEAVSDEEYGKLK